MSRRRKSDINPNEDAQCSVNSEESDSARMNERMCCVCKKEPGVQIWEGREKGRNNERKVGESEWVSEWVSGWIEWMSKWANEWGRGREREREEQINRAKKNVLRSDIGQSVKRLYHIILKQYCST